MIAVPLASEAAPGDRHRDSENDYELRVPDGWSQQTVRHKTAREQLLAGWRGSGGEAMVVTRLDIRTPMARRKKKAFFATLEAGLRDRRAGYKRIRRRHHKTRRVRGYDLVFRHGIGEQAEVVAMRFLFFRRYTLTLALSIPARRWRGLRRTVGRQLASFRPYFGK